MREIRRIDVKDDAGNPDVVIEYIEQITEEDTIRGGMKKSDGKVCWTLESTDEEIGFDEKTGCGALLRNKVNWLMEGRL